MKNFKIFAAAFTAIALMASCAKDDLGGRLTNGDQTFAGFSISIPMGSPASRAGETGTGYASDIESTITKVGVFVVGNGSVDKLFLETSGTDFEFDAATGIATAKKAVSTTTGNKDIYVVANYTADLKTALSVLDASEFENYVIALDESGFMTDGVSLVMTGKTPNQTLTAMTAQEALAPANLKEVEVYRNLAKVVVRYGTASASTIQGGGRHLSLEFGLFSKARGAFLYNTPNAGATATAFTTVPAAAKADETHAYWSNFSSNNVGAAAANWVAVNAYAATPTFSSLAGLYAHENVYAAGELFSGNVTAARIRGQYVPDTTITGYDATSGDKTQTDTSGGSAGVTFYRHRDGSCWSEAAYTAATANSTDVKHILPAYFSGPYTDGWGYYRINVMDQARALSVMRNNYYDLAIESITGPGSPLQESPGTTVNDPIDENSFVAVKVKVMPWWKQSTTHMID